MNRIDAKFLSLQKDNKAAFISFVTAGDPYPSVADNVKVMQGLVAGGTDIIELGVPFSDPSADGVAIQKSNERALTHNIGITDVLAIVSKFREIDNVTPVVLMGYLNPIENMGYELFLQQAKSAGVDGLITVDMPPEEAHDFTDLLIKYDVYPIYLLAPTSTQYRIELVAKASRGFIYYVSVKGVTGDKEPDYTEVSNKVKSIKLITDLPVIIGFGIKSSQSVKQATKFADGVVVGSAIVNYLQTVNQSDLVESTADFVNKLTG